MELTSPASHSTMPKLKEFLSWCFFALKISMVMVSSRVEIQGNTKEEERQFLHEARVFQEMSTLAMQC